MLLGLFVVGLILIILLWVFISVPARLQADSQMRGKSPFTVSSDSKIDDAILIIQPGGRVEYMSEAARAYFELHEDEQFDLEKLARQVRPSDDFLNLCAVPGSKRVTLSGKLVEIASFQVPGAYPAMLVSLRSKDALPALGQEAGASSELFQMISEFTDQVSAQLDLNGTIRSILEHIDRILPSDILELKLWDGKEQRFVSIHTYTLDGQIIETKNSQFGGLTNQLLEQTASLLVTDAQIQPELTSSGELRSVRSYLGVKLIAGGEVVGVIEAGQTGKNSFSAHELDLLQFVAGQTAVALRNAALYEEEQKRAAELAGLANLNQSLGVIRDVQDLYARLVQNIAPLFDAEITGFLLFDEEKRTLEGKNPFRGLPAQIVEIYRALIPAGGAAEQLLLSQKPIVASNAGADEVWRTLGLKDVAVAASLRENALIPLVSSGRMLGYLQFGHHAHGFKPFNEEELRLMNIVASQAAAIIENVLLVQQARARANRADALRRIASLSGSSATIEEILKYSVQEMANLFQVDTGAVFLLDENRGELHLQLESVYGITEDLEPTFLQIFVADPSYRFTVSGSQKPLISGRLSMDRRVLSAYRPLATRLNNESVLVVPLTVRDKSIGELMLGSRKPDYFNEYDLQLVTGAAGQLATAIESANLLAQTDPALRQRVDQLAGLNKLSKELGASLDIHHLLQVMQNESLRILRADSASIVVIEQGSDLSAPVILHTTGSSAPQAFSPRELTALRKSEMQAIAEYADGKPIPAEAFAASLIVPITHQGEKIGLLNLHTTSPNFFNLETAEFAQTFAIQAGISLSTAQRYQSERQRAELMRRRADTLVRLSDVSYHISYDQPLENVLNLIASGIRNATPFNVVLMSILEPDTGLLRRITAVGVPQESMNETLTRRQPLEALQQMMKPEFKISRSYFIPSDQQPISTSDLHMVTSDPTLSGNYSEIWNVDDMLLVPLEGTDEQTIGAITLDNPKDGLRPDRATIEAIEVFASQASLIINNAARQSELRSKIDSLASGLQRQQKLLKLTQNDLPVLLRKDLEQTISLHSLDRRVQRVRAGLAITESVSRQLDAASALSALGRETLTQLGMSVALVAENTPDGPRLLHVMGSFPRATNVEALFGQRNPLRACLQSGRTILVPNLDENDEWRDSSLLTSLRAKALICLPVSLENKPVAAMLAISPETMSSFTEEDQQVYLQIAQQTSLILQNISLLNQTKRRLDEVNLLLDFSRQLSGLNPDAIVHALLDSARKVLPHAHAGLALIWNSQAEVLVPQAVSGYADNTAMSMINYHFGEALPGIAFAGKATRRVDEINFSRDYNLSAENLAFYRQATGGRLPVSSLIIPIIAGEQCVGILVLDNFNATSAFRVDDESLLLSLAQQVALSLENVRLVQTTQERAGQLQALNTAAASLTSSLSSDQLINALLDQLTPVLPYDTATLWLRDKDRLTVSSTRGFSDTEKRLGLSVSITDSALFKEMAQTAQPILINDVREDSRFVPVEAPRLSWLGIPLISKGELVGAIAVEKWQSHYYSREQMQVGLTFASQSAVSLDNARLYEDSVGRATELNERSQRMSTLNRFSSGLNGLLDADQILSLTAEELFKGMGLKRVSIVTFERGQAIWKISTPRPRLKLPRELPNAPIFSRLRESLGIFSADDARSEPDLAPLFDLLGDSAGALLILPLVSGQALNALVFIQMTGSGRFSMNEVELARTISNQAAIALENARLYQSSVRTAERFAILNETSSQMNASLAPEEIYVAAHKAAERLVPLEFFLITLLDEEKNEIDPVYLVDRGKRF
ncbi:MAG: GAF domain-containing protein, partial [Anaerolineales bacterium]|nr:GAF domain-containing protein [Anaerolineales bacterium]